MKAWIQGAVVGVIGIAIATFAIFFRRRGAPPLDRSRTAHLDNLSEKVEAEDVNTIEIADAESVGEIKAAIQHLDPDDRVEAIADLLR